MHKIDEITLLIKHHFIGSGDLEEDKKALLALLEKHPELNLVLEEFNDKKRRAELFKQYENVETNHQDILLERILQQIQDKPKQRYSTKRMITGATTACVLIIGGYS